MPASGNVNAMGEMVARTDIATPWNSDDIDGMKKWREALPPQKRSLIKIPGRGYDFPAIVMMVDSIGRRITLDTNRSWQYQVN